MQKINCNAYITLCFLHFSVHYHYLPYKCTSTSWRKRIIYIYNKVYIPLYLVLHLRVYFPKAFIKVKPDRRSCTESRHRINLFPSYPTYTHILQIELVCLNTISIHLQNLWQIEFFSIPCIRWFSKKNFILRTLQHMLWGTFLTNMCMPNFFPIPFTFGVRT